MPFSSSQKLCSAGERECDTGQPMIPASLVRPVILIVTPSSRLSRSSRQQSPVAQKTKKLDQRQAQDREILPVDAREQLHAAAFETIGADRPEQRLAFRLNIGIEKFLAEMAHRQF